MTLVGLGMLIVFGFLSLRHFRNGRMMWGGIAAFGSLLGAASLWVDYQRAMIVTGELGKATSAAEAQASNDVSSESGEDVFGAYEPD